LDKDIIFFMPSITMQQRANAFAALDAVKQTVQDAVRTPWVDIPILFTEEDSWDAPPSLEGYLIIPINFETDSLVKHIKETISQVRAVRERIRNNILKIASIRKLVVKSFDLNNIGISLSLSTEEVSF
jgi:hypothetical protein